MPHYRQKESYDFNTIVKIIFDAGIMAGTGCEYDDFHIQDARFYIMENEERKFVIPPEYKNSKE